MNSLNVEDGAGLGADVIGMLILNELKCLRRELTDEVKKIGERLTNLPQMKFKFRESMSGDISAEVTDDFSCGTLRQPMNLLSRSEENANLLHRSTKETFKEVLSDSSIIESHAAFNMGHPAKELTNYSRYSAGHDGDICDENFLVLPGFNHRAGLPLSKVLGSDIECGGHQYDVNHDHSYLNHAESLDHLESSILVESHAMDVNKQIKKYKKFKCEICSKNFSTKGSLLRHNHLHSGVRKFVCKVCGKGFFRSDHLNTHFATHTHKKSFSCHVCKRRFSSSQNLQKHSNMHSLSLVATAVPAILHETESDANETES
ncbi:unnamed protein product [Clavelina lepadiformis]|uniref:C2H2-type domain-containing protein n=1 Tax=Clavelina lepadiformis TaxID=159417 RepID=A0ABP0FLW0_CLALP